MKQREIRILDLLVLLDNTRLGASSPQIGFEDSQQALDTFLNGLNKKVMIPNSSIESALWACNLLDEQGKFKHPKDLTLDQFVSSLLKKGEKFNKKYNFIRGKDEV